jgi:hypothetical protein
MTREQAIASTVARLYALRDITRTTGFITTRAQQNILKQLPDEVMVEIVYQLQLKEEAVANEARKATS